MSGPLPDQLKLATEEIVAGRYAKAEPILRRYVEKNPDDVNGIRLLGELGMSLGALRDAQALLFRCTELAPDYHPARFAYANVLYKRHQYEASLEQIDKLLTIEEQAGWLVLKAANLVEINEHEQAIPIFRKIIEDYPDHRQAYLSLGHALRAVGAIDDSIDAYEQCISLGSDQGEAFWSLANLKTYRFSADQVAQMRTLLKDRQCPRRDYYHLLFSLGKSLEDKGEYEEAMAAYTKGNQIRGRMVPWKPETFSQDTQELIGFFSRELFTQRGAWGSDAKDPIFIVGLPRSGSTLVEQILASHSQVEGTAELADIIAMARKISGKRRRSDESMYPSALADMTRDQIGELGDSYVKSTSVQRITEAPHFIDKMPNNFSHVGLIHLILPNAKIIDARRHPIDCCFSNFKQLFASGQGFTYSQERIGKYYRDYLKIMNHWDEVLPGKVHRVIYEEMVNDTENEVRRLLEFCELPFESNCLEFYRNERTVRTASSEQVRQPIYQQGIGQWEPFAIWLDPLRRALGDYSSWAKSSATPSFEGGE